MHPKSLGRNIWVEIEATPTPWAVYSSPCSWLPRLATSTHVQGTGLKRKNSFSIYHYPVDIVSSCHCTSYEPEQIPLSQFLFSLRSMNLSSFPRFISALNVFSSAWILFWIMAQQRALLPSWHTLILLWRLCQMVSFFPFCLPPTQHSQSAATGILASFPLNSLSESYPQYAGRNWKS